MKFDKNTTRIELINELVKLTDGKVAIEYITKLPTSDIWYLITCLENNLK